MPRGKKKRERGTNPPSRNVHAEDPRSRRVARGAVDAPLYPMSSSSFFAGVERALSFMTRSTCEDDGGVATVSEGVSNGGGGTRKHRPRSIWGAGCGSDDDPGERNRPGRTRTALASIPARTLSPAGNPGRSAWMRSWQLLLGCIADSIATAEPGGAVARSVRPARARDERIISPTPVSSRAPGFRRAERRRWVRERRPRTRLLRRADSRGEVRARSPSARECVCVGGRRAANDGREGSISFFSPLPRGFQPENVRVRRLESAVFSRRRKCHPSVIRADRGENI